MDALQICYDFAPAIDVRRPESKRKATQMGFSLWRVSTDIGTVDFLMQQTVYVSQHEFEVRTEHYRLSFVFFFNFKQNRGSVTNSTDRQTRLVRCLSHFEERFEVHLA